MNARKQDIWSTSIDSVMIFQTGKWTHCNRGLNDKLYLRVHYDNLFIIHGDKILEKITGKMKGVFKDDIIIIAYHDGNGIRKIKFRLKADNIGLSIQRLSSYFPMVNHKQSGAQLVPRYRSLDQVLNCAIDNTGTNKYSMELPANYGDFLKLCLLDPVFPQVVTETQKMIDQIKNLHQ